MTERAEGAAAAGPAGFDRWIDAFGLRAELGGLIHTVCSWVARCAPPGASAEARALSCMDLCVFFTLDDTPAEAEVHERYERLLDGEAPGPTASPLAHAGHALLQQVAALEQPMERYLAGRRELLRAYRRRARARGGEPIGFGDYLGLRTVTVYLDPWVTLWELLDAPRPLRPDRDPVERRAIRTVARWQALRNDLASLRRDEASGERNLVFLLQAERGLGRPAAAAVIGQMAQAARREIDQLTELLSRRGDGGRGRWLAEALRVSVTGAEVHYRDGDPARYDG